MRKNYRMKRLNASRSPARKPYQFFFPIRLIFISFIALLILVIAFYFRGGDRFSFSPVVVPSPDTVLAVKPIAKIVKPKLVFNFQNRATQAASDHTAYFLQLGSFSDMHQAQMLQDSVRRLGFSPAIRPVEAGSQVFYRVQLGSYKQQAAANEVQKQLEDSEISSVLIRMSDG